MLLNQSKLKTILQTEAKRMVSLLVIVLAMLCISACGVKEKSIQLNKPIKVGNWEFTLTKIEFADEVSRLRDYERFLVPGNTYVPLPDGQIYGVYTYTFKYVGEEEIWRNQSESNKDYGFLHSGMINHGDKDISGYGDSDVFIGPLDGGFCMEGQTSFGNAEELPSFEETPYPMLEYRGCVALSQEIIENTDEELFFFIALNNGEKNQTFKYIVPQEYRTVIITD